MLCLSLKTIILRLNRRDQVLLESCGILCHWSKTNRPFNFILNRMRFHGPGIYHACQRGKQKITVRNELTFPSFPCSSAGKESSCNAGDPTLIPGKVIGYPLQYSWISLVAQLVKNLPHNMGDLGSIPGLGKSLGEGKGYPLMFWHGEFHGLYIHGVAKSWTKLSDFQHLYISKF